jgi:hypothetical protein
MNLKTAHPSPTFPSSQAASAKHRRPPRAHFRNTDPDLNLLLIERFPSKLRRLAKDFAAIGDKRIVNAIADCEFQRINFSTALMRIVECLTDQTIWDDATD